MSDILTYRKQKEELLNELNKGFQKSAFLMGYYDFKIADLIETYIYLDPKYKNKKEEIELDELNEALNTVSEIVGDFKNSIATINLFSEILKEKGDFKLATKELVLRKGNILKDET